MSSAAKAVRVRDLLIVDDDVAQVRLFEALLGDLGLRHRCHHAESGRMALDFLRRREPYQAAPRPELIILDVNMSGMDGYAVLQELKIDPDLRNIPVIMFSMGGRDEDIDRCYRERANAYVRKPEDYESNLHVVRAIERFWFHTATLAG